MSGKSYLIVEDVGCVLVGRLLVVVRNAQRVVGDRLSCCLWQGRCTSLIIGWLERLFVPWRNGLRAGEVSLIIGRIISVGSQGEWTGEWIDNGRV